MANRTMKHAIRRELARRKMTVYAFGALLEEQGVVPNLKAAYRALAIDDPDTVDRMAEALGLHVRRKR